MSASRLPLLLAAVAGAACLYGLPTTVRLLSDLANGQRGIAPSPLFLVFGLLVLVPRPWAFNASRVLLALAVAASLVMSGFVLGILHASSAADWVGGLSVEEVAVKSWTLMLQAILMVVFGGFAAKALSAARARRWFGASESALAA